MRRAETFLFFIAVVVALALPALPLLQELRPDYDPAVSSAQAAKDQPGPQQVALAR